MKHFEITFKEFSNKYSRDFPDNFRYLETPVQIYNVENIFSKNIAAPIPLLKANFNFIAFPINGNFEQQVGNEVKKMSANQALLVMQGL